MYSHRSYCTVKKKNLLVQHLLNADHIPVQFFQQESNLKAIFKSQLLFNYYKVDLSTWTLKLSFIKSN